MAPGPGRVPSRPSFRAAAAVAEIPVWIRGGSLRRAITGPRSPWPRGGRGAATVAQWLLVLQQRGVCERFGLPFSRGGLEKSFVGRRLRKKENETTAGGRDMASCLLLECFQAPRRKKDFVLAQSRASPFSFSRR